MPASRSSIRARMLSLATIWLTEKCFPMSRRKSRIRNVCRPRSIVHEPRRILFRFEIQQFRQLNFDAGDVAIQNFLREQLAFLGFAAGITDRAGRAAGDGNRMMAEQLKPPQRQQRHKMADVQAVGGRVETAIKRDGRRRFLFQFRRVGAIGDEAAPFQFFQDAHAGRLNRCGQMPIPTFVTPTFAACSRTAGGMELPFASILLVLGVFEFEDEHEDEEENDFNFGL